MSPVEVLHTQYITNDSGERISAVVPLEEYEALLEDLADLATLAERRDDETVSHAELVARLKADGLLQS